MDGQFCVKAQKKKQGCGRIAGRTPGLVWNRFPHEPEHRCLEATGAKEIENA